MCSQDYSDERNAWKCVLKPGTNVRKLMYVAIIPLLKIMIPKEGFRSNAKEEASLVPQRTYR